MAKHISDYAILEIGYAKVLLPKEEAVKAFLALNDAELVEYDYTSKGLKPSTGHTEGVVKLSSCSVAQLAILELNRSSADDAK